ncbi:hypothetical protein CARUB_v10023689mg [Capsella rubella]|uniref:Proline-rich protein n=1 Tax=Capsella rubella TaxID=81985 RepID=R0FXV5_9BRAS|nr:proline-rich protein 2 [Capsella rubella]EOA27551.1 hypothetical protein CARUB_v10023689mg [Capsella rubella]
MRILPKNGGAYCLLVVFALCSVAHSLIRDVKVVGDVEVVGYGNAESSKIKIPNAFSGLRVTIECKAADSKAPFVTKGSGEIGETGKFHLNMPNDIVGDDGALKEACYAHLYSTSGTPCPTHNGLEASKIIFLSKSGENHVFGLKQSLKFSPEVCISKFFWHMPKFHVPDLSFPKIKKPCPPIYKPPVVIPKKPCPPKISHKPIYKAPVPIYKAPVPIHKPPVVIHKKPFPPKIAHKPIYKQPVPIYKPKKPCPPPIHKPSVPIYKPIYKPPVVVIPKKPCPPLPKFPSFPPKYIPHPKFGKWPPFPSHP